MNKEGIRRLRRLFEIIEVGNDLDWISRTYDYVNVSTIVLNLIASVLYTYDGIREQYGTLLLAVEIVTAVFFAVDYVAECEKALSKHLGRGVKIVNGKRKGRFELEFYGQDDLQVLLEALMTLKGANNHE